MPSATNLKITEIFYSIQGETRTTGCPTTFVRLTGCPLRCTYCDSAYAFHGGQYWSLETIMAEVAKYPTPYVTVTGGEPLAQKNVLTLLTMLCDKGYNVSLETSGAMAIADVDSRVSRVVDIKTPSSGEMHRHRIDQYAYLTTNDQIKCVIGNLEDYQWAKAHVLAHQLHTKVPCFFSPCTPGMNPTTLADWIIEDQLPVRLQIQLHKTLWGDVPGK